MRVSCFFDAIENYCFVTPHYISDYQSINTNQSINQLLLLLLLLLEQTCNTINAVKRISEPAVNHGEVVLPLINIHQPSTTSCQS